MSNENRRCRGLRALMDYNRALSTRRRAAREIDFVLTVKANVTTLLPLLKRRFAKYGAHKPSAGEVTVQIRSDEIVWIEDLIAVIEKIGEFGTLRRCSNGRTKRR